MSVHCSCVVTSWERASLLALLYVIYSCVFVTFPCGVLGQVWDLIVSIPDLLLFLTFNGQFVKTVATHQLLGYCKFGKFPENFISAKSVKSHICDVKIRDKGMIYLYQ